MEAIVAFLNDGFVRIAMPVVAALFIAAWACVNLGRDTRRRTTAAGVLILVASLGVLIVGSVGVMRIA